MSTSVPLLRLQSLTCAGLLAACHGQPGSLVSSTQPTSPSVSPVPTLDGFRVSGVVYERTPSGAQPVLGGTVFLWLESALGGQAFVDTSGRYTISGVPNARIARVVWTPGSGGLYQLSPANAPIVGDTTLDIEVVRVSARGFTCDASTLSGVIFEATPEGRRSLADARVFYYMNDWAGFDLFTRTDANGHYQFCGIPRSAGRVGAGDCNDAVLVLPIEVNGDMVFDVDLTSFNASCP